MSDTLEPTSGSGAETSAAAPTVRWPWLWLLGILALGLVLRGMSLWEPLQGNEFPSLYAVAERKTEASPGYTPAASDPLVPVAGWEEVRQRSVLPYGIVNPVPLYHYLLFAVTQVLPVTEWSLRLPSLLAGLACIVGVYLLCRHFLGDEVALVAALFAAVDPIQSTTSVLALPYALGNLACLLSFAALLGVLYSRSVRNQLLSALGYGVSLALVGYLNAMMLLVVVAHLGLVAYRVLNPDPPACRHRPLVKGRQTSSVVAWLAGVGLAVGLMTPQLGYLAAVGQFAHQHQAYFILLGELKLMSILTHNSAFLIALLIVSLASYVARQIQLAPEETEEAAVGTSVAGASGEQSTTTPPAPPAPTAAAVAELPPPPPDSPDLVWLGRAWFFWPQMAAMLLAYGLGQAIFVTRFLSYTTLGGVILLAYWATRERTRDMRLGVAAAVALTIFLWGLLPVGRGFGLLTPATAHLTMKAIDGLEKKGSWQPNDVLLVRSSYPEADFLTEGVPEANRQHVTGALLSPYTTLYLSQKPRPIVLLSKSQRRGEALHTDAGTEYDPEGKYNTELADKLRGFNQFWVASNNDTDRTAFLACFLPWLADAVDSDLQTARNRLGPERYFDVYTGSKPEDYLEGLTDASASDFTHVVRIQRRRPPWAFRIGGITDVPAGRGVPGLALQAWRLAQDRTPRLTELPQEDLSAWLNEPVLDR